jgi:hypothetical protein
MFPQSEIDKSECLESLVGIRTGCTADKRFPFWIEDIEGVDVPVLAAMAKGSNGNGKDFGQQLINAAAREFLGDIELLINNGYGLKEIAADMCSSNTLLTSYTANAGIIVKSNIYSRFQQLKITKLQVLTNVTGERQLRFDDGFATTDYKVQLEAGKIMPMDFNYTTDRDQVTIRFTDPTVGVGKVSINKGSGCGCSGGKVLGDVTPNIFGLALFYKVAEKFFLNKAQSKRNNDTVSFNEGEPSEFVRNYGMLYASKLYGKADRKAVKHVVSDYLKKNHKDCCVICNSRSMTAAITG